MFLMMLTFEKSTTNAKLSINQRDNATKNNKLIAFAKKILIDLLQSNDINKI